MKILRTIYFWFVFILITLCCSLVVFVYKGLSIIFGKKDISRFVHSVANLWGKLIFKFTPSWSVIIEGKENLPKFPEFGVIVANHESMTDILALHCLGIQYRWISKDSIFKIPVIGQCMKWAGYVSVKRGVKQSHSQALKQASDILSKGICMLFFPEGTRSETGEIKPFKFGAFKLAAEHNLPIFPIVLKGTRDLIPKKSIFVGKAQVKIYCLPKVYKDSAMSVEDFASKVRDIMINVKNKI